MKPATPLPWGTDLSTASFWTVIGAGRPIATIYDDDGAEANGYRTSSGYGAQEAERDAAYIAHAANLYPELVETCKAALGPYTQAPGPGQLSATKLIALLQRTLARCEGE